MVQLVFDCYGKSMKGSSGSSNTSLIIYMYYSQDRQEDKWDMFMIVGEKRKWFIN